MVVGQTCISGIKLLQNCVLNATKKIPLNTFSLNMHIYKLFWECIYKWWANIYHCKITLSLLDVALGIPNESSDVLLDVLIFCLLCQRFIYDNKLHSKATTFKSFENKIRHWKIPFWIRFKKSIVLRKNGNPYMYLFEPLTVCVLL